MTTGRIAFAPMTQLQFVLSVLLMGIIVVASNILVQYPINHWLTWGAISYPVAFLVTDLLNRRFGPTAARRVAYVGFVSALIVSVWVATPRIALASGLAFLCAQLADISVFHKLRHRTWWRAPLVGGIVGATLDTVVFFSVAFTGTGVHWPALLMGDLAVKLAVNTTMLAPFRALMWNLGKPAESVTAAQAPSKYNRV